MTLSVDDAIDATRGLGTELGITASPLVLADKSNLVLRLDPHPIVARVAMATSLARVGMAWLRREVDVSRFLVERGVPVTKPAALVDPGPFERGGFVISFWELETILAERAGPSAAGASLAEAHRALAGYVGDPLPEWGAFEEARSVLARAKGNRSFAPSELARIEAAWDRAERIVESARRRSASFQVVHGDAHIANVLATSRGAVWTDWEDAFVGPVEYDIACLRSKADLFGEERDAIDAMTAAYGDAYDRDLARDLTLVRNVQVIVWLAVFAERQPELLPRMRARIERLP